MIALMLTTLPPDSRPRAAPRYGAGGRIVGARAHHSRAYSVWKAAAAAEARACWAGRPALAGPVAVTICAVLPPPKTARPMGGAPRRWAPRKPDVDNIAKGVMDALTDAGVWEDDAQVVALTVRRFWGAVMPRERGAELVVELGGIEIFVGPADDAGRED